MVSLTPLTLLLEYEELASKQPGEEIKKNRLFSDLVKHTEERNSKKSQWPGSLFV